MKEDAISDYLLEAIVSYYQNKLTREQAVKLLAWIGEDKENLIYFREMGKLWYASGMTGKSKIDTGAAWIKLCEKIEENERRPLPKPVIKFRISSIYRIAATIILLIALGSVTNLIFKNRSHAGRNNYFEAVAPKGSRSVITLSEGTVIWLNSDTKIRYKSNFGQTSREVILEGEAFFRVAENKNLPFIVSASDICITALGTSFNVKAYSSEDIIETTLESGEIRIDNKNEAVNNISNETIYLKPNQKAVYYKNGSTPGVVKIIPERKIDRSEPVIKAQPVQIKIDTLVDTKLSTSWKESRWIFKSEKLNMLVPILERRYDVNITFKDSVLSNYKFTGTLKEESLEQVLKALTIAAPIRFEVAHNQVFLWADQSQMERYKRKVYSNNK